MAGEVVEITRLKVAKSNPDRVHVHLDGGHRMSLAAEIIQREGLRVGSLIDHERWAALEEQDAGYRARDDAVRLLAYRARSREELRRRLRRRDYADAVIEACLSRLEEQGYIDDADFARAFIRDRLRLRPGGRYGLERELRSRGVATETARRAIQQVFGEEEVNEEALALEEAERWMRGKGRRAAADPVAGRRRLHGFLSRRGFDPASIRLAIDAVLGD